MTRRMIAALLAAATMMPTMAAAQDRGQRGERAERARGDSDPGRDQARQQRQRPEQAQERRVAQPERRGDRDQAQRQRAEQAQRVVQRRRPAQMLEQRAGQPDRRDQRPAPNYRDRNNDGRADWRNPGGYDRGRDGWNRDGVNRDGVNRNGWRGSPRYNGGDYRRWNNNWRNDRRYDWRGYRGYNRGVFRLPRYYAPYGWRYGYRRYSIGVRIGAPLFASSYWISDPYYYRLPPAYGGYRWVRYYNDALLVDVRTGYVVDVIHGIFW